MSRDLQEAIKLIRDMTSFMDPEEDYLTIVALEEETAAAESKRKKELEEAHANLKSLIKIRDAARKTCARPASVLSAEAHAAFLNEHDVDRLQLAKAINEAESEQAKLEAELAALKEEARALEEDDPVLEHEAELGGAALRLRTYKGLGFEPILDKDGNMCKMIVCSQSGDLHTVDLPDGTADFEKCNLLWKLASS